MKLFRGRYLLVLISMCGLVATTIGMLTNVSGLFFDPIAADFGIGRGTVSLTLTICNLALALGGMLAPRLVTEKRFKLVLILGTALTVGLTAVMALASNIWVLYICNAVRGLAAGTFGLVLVTMVINNWFHANAGLATSIAMSCSGLAGAALSPVLSAVIQAAGWRTGYLAAAGIMLALNLPALLCPIAFRPEAVGLLPLTDGKTSKAAPSLAQKARPIVPVLFVLTLGYGVIASIPSAFPPHFPGLAGSYTLTAAVGSGMLSAAMVANSAGKILYGLLSDRFGGMRTTLLYIFAVMAATIGLLALRASSVLIGCAGVFGLCYTLSTVTAVILTKDMFGLENYSRVYPKVTLSITVFNAICSTLFGYMYDATGSYTVPLIAVLATLFAALAIIVSAYSVRKRVRA